MVKSISRPFLLQFRNVAPDCADEAMAAAIWPLTIPPREPSSGATMSDTKGTTQCRLTKIELQNELRFLLILLN